MPKENLIYNYNGDKYWEPFFNEESGRLNLYEGNHGHYVGLVVRFEADVMPQNRYSDYSEYTSYEQFFYDYRMGLETNLGFSQEIVNLHDGTYIGEIKRGRLIINEEKERRRKIRENIFYRPFGRMGYIRQPNIEKVLIPKGYRDFEEGWT